MKLLLDQNISYRAAKPLNNVYKVCKHISDCGLLNREDEDIWSYAKKHEFTVVTFDSDFYDMSILYGHPPKIILLRTGNLTKHELVALLISKEETIQSFMKNDVLSTISCLEIF